MDKSRSPSSCYEDIVRVLAHAYTVARNGGIKSILPSLLNSQVFRAEGPSSFYLSQTSNWTSSTNLSASASFPDMSSTFMQNTSLLINNEGMDSGALDDNCSRTPLCSNFSITEENNENTSNNKRKLGARQRTLSKKNKKHLKSIRFWEQMRDSQVNLMKEICTSTYSIANATSYTNECWEILIQVHLMLRSRPLELQQSIQSYICEAIKITEYLIIQGCDDVSIMPSKFILTIFGRYLKRRKCLNEHNRGWIQSREIMRIVCQTVTIVDILLGLMAAMNELMLTFVKSNTSDCMDRDEKFVSYAIGQITDLIKRINERIQQCRTNKNFASYP